MSRVRTEVHPIYLRLAPADIALAKFLIESCEGVGVVRTVDREAAIIVVLVVHDFLPVAREIVAALQTQIACVEVEGPRLPADDWLMREIAEPDPE